MCKKITVILSVVSLSFCLLAKEKIRDLSSLQEQEGGSLLIVKSTNLSNSQGMIRLGLYKKKHAAYFPEGVGEGEYYLNAQSKIAKDNTATIVFKDLPKGVYAISAFHDEHDKGKLQKNFLGFPTSDWAVSNNIRHGLSVPNFEEASFKIEGREKVIFLEMGR